MGNIINAAYNNDAENGYFGSTCGVKGSCFKRLDDAVETGECHG